MSRLSSTNPTWQPAVVIVAVQHMQLECDAQSRAQLSAFSLKTPARSMTWWQWVLHLRKLPLWRLFSKVYVLRQSYRVNRRRKHNKTFRPETPLCNGALNRHCMLLLAMPVMILNQTWKYYLNSQKNLRKLETSDTLSSICHLSTTFLFHFKQ